MNQKIHSFRSFLDGCHSPYHAVAALARELESRGYAPLAESAAWSLTPGGKYYLTRGGSAILAFRIPECAPAGFMMSASHCDYPTFLVKENGELAGKYTRLATEKYGGMLIAPWLDRPLSVAGRVMVQTQQGIESRLVDIDRDLMLIPNVAIHLNRGVNDGYKWNPAVDTLPLLGGPDAAGKLDALLEEAAGGKILGHDLYLYLRQKSTVWGLEEEYISGQGLDDLACVWGCAQGFLAAKDSEAIPVLCVMNHEEVGSATPQGAGSDLLADTLKRICEVLDLDRERMLSQSFLVSADNAQALNPNHPELSDGSNAPVLNGGVAVKFNASRRYTTDGFSAAVLRKLCDDVQLPLQTFYNRADMPGGSTLGCVSVSHVAVNSVDIGIPQLAMHSCYETIGVHDLLQLETMMTHLYGSTLKMPQDGICCLK